MQGKSLNCIRLFNKHVMLGFVYHPTSIVPALCENESPIQATCPDSVGAGGPESGDVDGTRSSRN